MGEDTINRIQLELHVDDFRPVLDFYGKLGFKEVWQRSTGDVDDYLVMEKDGTVLNFWPGNAHVWEHSYFKQFPKSSKLGYGVEIVIPVDDIGTAYNTARQFAKVVDELKLRPWGVKDFRLEDPFGFYIRITERHNTLDPKYAVPKNK